MPPSINLERDNKNLNLLEEYHLTGKTIESLSSFAEALNGEKYRAWSLIGPYGMGKSAFVNYLLTIAGPEDNRYTQKAFSKLKATDETLYQKIYEGKANISANNGFFRIFVTSSYESVNSSLVRALENAIEESNLTEKSLLLKELAKLKQQDIINSQALFNLFKQVQKKSCQPLLIIIDEFGKNLDYSSHYHDSGDIFILQQLAESEAIYLWVCLHQAFDEYMYGLSAVQRQEWSKVQGRFKGISFVESQQQMLILIQKLLYQDFPKNLQNKINEWANSKKRFIQSTNLENKQKLNKESISRMYPLAPITAVALIEMCRRFAQNDRTLLAFLCNKDNLALPAYLESNSVETNNKVYSLGLEYLYDYFFSISSSKYVHWAESQRWIEIHDIISSVGSLSEEEKSLLKNIGVLNLLSGSIGVRANKDTLLELMNSSTGLDRESIAQMLNKLTNEGILLYREYSGEYRLWEGSDFDVNKAIKEKKSSLKLAPLATILQDYLPLSPVIASRHAYETGTIRRFERRWISESDLNNDFKPEEGYDGLLLYCFGYTKEPSTLPKQCMDHRPLLLAYAANQVTLLELALEVAAARAVFQESPELVHDSVARKEVKFRIKLADDSFREYLARNYTPGADELNWYHNGEKEKITNHKSFSQKLSELCDQFYQDCPYIGNEMISYEKISSTTARARRELIEAMVDKPYEEQLGLTGYGPEVAIYRSLICNQDLHIKDKNSNSWKLVLGGKDPAFKELWQTIDKQIQSSKQEGASVAEILKTIKNPPIGMRQGPALIYISLYILVKEDEIAVFQEGKYCPYLSNVEMALMLKRPELFVLKTIENNQEFNEVFQTYQELLRMDEIEVDNSLRNKTMLGVVGPLVRFVEELPQYTQNTRNISPQAIQVRTELQNATEPLRLIYQDLPSAVGIEFDNGKGESQKEVFKAELRKALKELSDAYPKLNQQIEEIMLNLFRAKNLSELYNEQRKRAEDLKQVCEEKELKAVIAAFAREEAFPDDWLKGIASMVLKKPVSSWSDNDLDLFNAKIKDYADRIDHLEAIKSLDVSLKENNAKLLTVMNPDGSFSRVLLKNSEINNEAQELADEVLSLPENDKEALLMKLLEELKGSEQ